MVARLFATLAVSLFSLSCAAQVVPDVYRPSLSTTAGAGLNYWSGDFGGTVNGWGPSVWGTVTVWHDLSIIAEGHSLVKGGSDPATQYKYFTGGGGLVYTSGYWGRFQPLFKGEAGYASLSHNPNGTGHLHHNSHIWTFGAGAEYHTWGQLWTRVEYDYDFFPNFHSGNTGQYHTLNPHGFIFGETFRFGASGSRF